jgi:hypothetical protein
MSHSRLAVIAVNLVLLLGATAAAFAQSTASGTNSSGSVPSLINYSGVLKDTTGKPLTSISGVTFSIYQDEQGGSPLWLETQNVQPDKYGHFTVSLGASSSQGLPSDLFSSGEARWLGVQAQGQAEQPRVMLLSVPYALKAADAQTIGGLPPSAFVLAAPASASGTSGGESPVISATTNVGGSGTTDYIPLWTSGFILGDSVLFQSGSGSSALVGINTTTPASRLDVNGGVTSRGNLQLPSIGTATASQGFNSQPFSLQGSSFNSGTGKATGPVFQWQAEPSGNNTSNPAGTLNLLYGTGSGSPTETGLNVASNGQITFASGQKFPGTGNGTITGVTAGSGLSGGGTSGTVTLSIPSAGVTNAMLQNSSITLNANTAGGLTTPGAMSLGSTNTIGLKPCSTNQILQYSGTAWNCATAATGTITGVTAGSGLSGGGTSGTVTLTNTGILNLTAGTGLSSTGGQSPTLSINTAVVPELGTPNAFTANLSTTGELAAGGAPSHNIANGTVEVDAGNANTGSYLPGLIFGGGGESISSNRAGTTNLDGIDFYTKKIPRMSLTNGGQFGINTTSPSHLFEVDASTTVAQMAMVSSGTDAAISVKNTATGGREYWIDSGSGNAGIGAQNFAVYDATAGATRFVIGPTGNVGIGTTSPNDSLEVNSNTTFGIFASGGSTTLAAVEGSANATTGAAWGVQGYTASDAADAYGVYGNAGNTGGTSEAVGVYGQSLGGFGVGTFGQYGLFESGTGQGNSGIFPAGSWGDAGQSVGGAGVVGTADDAAAGFFSNNSPSGYYTFQVNADNAASYLFFAGNSATGGNCIIDSTGDFSCSGQIGASVPLDGGARQVAMPAIQSPKNWFEDAGEAQLSNGRAVVTLDSDFIQTVNTNEKYEVFLTPYGECKGLYVTNRTANSFEVHELYGGAASVSFGFRIMALRKNYENVRFADHTAEMQKLREQNQRMHARKGSGQSHDPRRSPLLKPSGPQAELRPAAVK